MTTDLIDGMNILHRCFHAMRGPAKIDPAPDVLADATIRTINAYLHEFEGDWARSFVVFDGAGGTARRRAIFPEYKADRPGASDTITKAMNLAIDWLWGKDFRMVRVAGFEADDVLATYAARLVPRFGDVRILTSDKDLLQCVGDGVRVVNPRDPKTKQFTVWDEAAFVARYGFSPPLMADYKALCGDKSDGIPPVPGIGEVRASKLLAHGGIDALFARPSPLPEKLAKLIAGHEETARRNLALTTLDQDVPLAASRAA